MSSGEHPGIPASEPLGISTGNPALSGLEDKAAATPGVVFVLAAGGLRHIDGAGGFLGYPPRELFWTDVLEGPGDVGLLVVNVREAPPRAGEF